MTGGLKKPVLLLILCVVVLVIIANLAPAAVHVLNSVLDDNYESRYHKDYPTINGLSVPPGSYSYFYIKYPTTRLYIQVDRGDASGLKPMILDNAGFSLYRKGQQFQPVIGPDQIEKNLSSGLFTYNSSVGMDHYLLIKNDRNDTANVTIRMFVPM